MFKTSADRESAAAAAAAGAVAALAQPRAPPRGDRDAREPRRRREPPQLAAAGPRPAQARSSEPASLDATHIRDIPDYPEAGDRLPRHHAAAARRRGAGRGRRRPGRLGRARATSTSSSPPRRAASSSAARVARAARRRLRARPQAGQAAARHGLGRVHPRVRRRRAGDARRRARRTARGCSSTTTCWPRAGRRGRCATWSSGAGGDGGRLRVPDRAGVPGRPRAARPATTCTSLITYDARVITTRGTRSIAAPREARVGAGGRPVPPAALVAAGRARRGRDGARLDARAALRARATPCATDWTRGGTSEPVRAALGAGDRGDAVRAAVRAQRRRGARWSRPATGTQRDAVDRPAAARHGAVPPLRRRARRCAASSTRRSTGWPRRSRMSRREQVFWGWGEPGAGPSLPEHADGFLRGRARASRRGRRRRPWRSRTCACAAPALPARVRDRLAARSRRVRDDREIRVLRAAGKSYLDLLAQRAGDCDGAPDAVVAPRVGRRGRRGAAGVRRGGRRRRARSAAGRASSAASAPRARRCDARRLARPRRDGRGRGGRRALADRACSGRACGCPRLDARAGARTG